MTYLLALRIVGGIMLVVIPAELMKGLHKDKDAGFAALLFVGTIALGLSSVGLWLLVNAGIDFAKSIGF